jgi:hypothetical protein
MVSLLKNTSTPGRAGGQFDNSKPFPEKVRMQIHRFLSEPLK